MKRFTEIGSPVQFQEPKIKEHPAHEAGCSGEGNGKLLNYLGAVQNPIAPNAEQAQSDQTQQKHAEASGFRRRGWRQAKGNTNRAVARRKRVRSNQSQKKGA